jgi:hypothetical protein
MPKRANSRIIGGNVNEATTPSDAVTPVVAGAVKDIRQ